MTLRINLDTETGGEERITVPVLYIEYKERTNSYIQDNPLTEVTFLTEYRLSMDGFWRRAEWGFWLSVIGCILLCTGLTGCQWARPDPGMGGALAAQNRQVMLGVKLIVNLFDMFSLIFFCYLFAVTGATFVFFKLQERVYCFMPGIEAQKEAYRMYDWLFSIVVGTKLLYMLFKIYFE